MVKKRKLPPSKWASTPVELRHRKPFHATLDEATFVRLDALAGLLGLSRSEVVDEAIALLWGQRKLGWSVAEK